MRLIICGNGFDLHHDPEETGYAEYRKHLKQTLPSILKKFEEFPWLPQKCEGDLWKDVEQSLALNFHAMIEHLKKHYADPNGEIEYKSDFENWTRFIFSFTGDEYYKWISSVDISAWKKDEKLEQLFSEAMFVTFNYTDTLECLYGIPSERILYLHGRLSNVAHGACLSQDILPSFQAIEEAECYNKPIIESDKWNSDIIRDEIQFGAPLNHENELNSILDGISQKEVREAFNVLVEKTTKKPYRNIPDLKAFLEGKSIDEVTIMGHSMTGADELYYNNCLIPQYKDTKWIAYVHDDNDREQKAAFLEKYDIIPEYREW